MEPLASLLAEQGLPVSCNGSNDLQLLTDISCRALIDIFLEHLKRAILSVTLSMKWLRAI